MSIVIPELSLVVLIGVSGSGKSTFARKHFKPTEILSSDFCRGLVSDDENSQATTKDAFEMLHFIAQAARGTGPRVSLPTGRDRSGCAGTGRPRTKQNALRPRFWPPCYPSAGATASSFIARNRCPIWG